MMSKNNFVKFFVIVSVMLSLTCIGGKTTYAKNITSTKVEVNDNLKLKERVNSFYEKICEELPILKKNIKDCSDVLIKEVIKKKKEVLGNIVNKLIETVNEIGESNS